MSDRIYMLATGIVASIGFSFGQVTHSEAVQQFFQPTTKICCEGTMMNYLKNVKMGTGMIVFERQLKTQKLSNPICRFEIKNGQVVEPIEVIADNSKTTIDLSQFLLFCKDPALLQYKKKVYLNIPNMTAMFTDGKTISELLCPQLSEALKNLPAADPKAKLRCAIAIPGIGNQIPLGIYRIYDTIDREAVVESACKYIEKDAYGEWKKQHEAKMRKLPRRAPVVYGNVKDVTRTSLGTFIIPKTPPRTERTISKSQIFFPDGSSRTINHGEDEVVIAGGNSQRGEYVPAGFITPISSDIVVSGGDSPIAITEKRKKKISINSQYADLKRQLEEYEALVRDVENDKPPTANKQEVANAMRTKDCKLMFSICK